MAVDTYCHRFPGNSTYKAMVYWENISPSLWLKCRRIWRIWSKHLIIPLVRTRFGCLGLQFEFPKKGTVGLYIFHRLWKCTKMNWIASDLGQISQTVVTAPAGQPGMSNTACQSTVMLCWDLESLRANKRILTHQVNIAQPQWTHEGQTTPAR